MFCRTWLAKPDASTIARQLSEQDCSTEIRDALIVINMRKRTTLGRSRSPISLTPPPFSAFNFAVPIPDPQFAEIIVVAVAVHDDLVVDIADAGR